MHYTDVIYAGYIASTKDALLIFEATRQGLLPIVPERLTTSEKQEIRPGSIFIFCEQQSKIKRWTDARLWSPSRVR